MPTIFCVFIVNYVYPLRLSNNNSKAIVTIVPDYAAIFIYHHPLFSSSLLYLGRKYFTRPGQ